MCGIAGIYYFDHERKVDPSQLKRMSDTIAYRGPDGEGFYQNGFIGLAHRRLSIIDLSTGSQPMYSDDRKIVIVFNGEIYNYIELKLELEALGYHFKTSSDTEVIIRAYQQWGVDCQQKFNGMWSLAIWDQEQRQLFITRDRMGEKPLYYGNFDGAFLFGSEIKCLGAYGAALSPDPEMLELYLFLGYIPEPYTFYKNISKLKAGHYLLIRDQEVKEHTYWDLPDPREKEPLTDPAAVSEEFHTLLGDAVRIRMRSDVAYGAFLSGGLDSSAIVGLMSGVSSKPVETFTIGFNEKEFDERPMAQLVADRFATNHHQRVVEPERFDQALRDVILHYDEPFADPAAIPMGIVSGYAAQYVKMVLTGDGADELLAGYSVYESENMVGSYRRLPRFIRHGLPALAGASAGLLTGSLRYRANRAARVLRNFNAPFPERLISKSVKIPVPEMKSFSNGKGFPIEDFVSGIFQQTQLTDPFDLLNYYHLKVSLPGQMLVKVDRMSMARSIETRAPFLDHRIVEYLAGVDPRLKKPHQGSVKNILKMAMTGLLPPEIINRRKKGFDVPLREWFKDQDFDQKLRQDFGDYGLNADRINAAIAENKQGKADHGTLIWRLLIYTNWMKQF